MNHDFNTTEDKELQKQHPDQAQLDSALRSFRQSMHAWSEAEFSRPRSVRPAQSPLWRWLAAPAVSWAAAALLAVTAIGVPAAVRHERQVQVIARERVQRQQRQAQEQAQEKASMQLATTVDDDKLLQHVDEDIRQSAPDALEPLASLMSTSGEE